MTLRLCSALLLVALVACSAPRAASMGDSSMVEEHLARGVRVDDRFDEDGCRHCTLLHHAARGGHVEVAALLVRRGADVNAVSGSGVTPLHLACLSHIPEMVQFLLDNGAKSSVAARDPLGATPLLYAVADQQGRSAPVPIFTRAGVVVVPTPVVRPHRIVKHLLAAGADPGVVTKTGLTPLHIAADKGDLGTIRMLLEAGAQVGATTDAGETPLHVAAVNGDPDAVALLVAAGAPVGASTREGNTPLHLAAARGERRTITLLLESGAERSVANVAGDTPAAIAHRRNDWEALELLLTVQRR